MGWKKSVKGAYCSWIVNVSWQQPISSSHLSTSFYETSRTTWLHVSHLLPHTLSVSFFYMSCVPLPHNILVFLRSIGFQCVVVSSHVSHSSILGPINEGDNWDNEKTLYTLLNSSWHENNLHLHICLLAHTTHIVPDTHPPPLFCGSQHQRWLLANNQLSLLDVPRCHTAQPSACQRLFTVHVYGEGCACESRDLSQALCFLNFCDSVLWWCCSSLLLWWLVFWNSISGCLQIKRLKYWCTGNGRGRLQWPL